MRSYLCNEHLVFSFHVQNACGIACDKVQTLVMLAVPDDHAVSHAQQTLRHVSEIVLANRDESRRLPSILKKLLLVCQNEKAGLFVD